MNQNGQIDNQTIEKCKKEYKEKGFFLADEFSITDVFPDSIFFGRVKEIIGYEPDNYKLESVYVYEGKIHTSAEVGNGWTVYGITEEKFAREIEEALNK